ncbi:MAG: DUF1887 family CARF protein [Alcaligenaceae bacterium]|nr:DUF1887 family CARF protein [Alcaligenaceae bacterium]
MKVQICLMSDQLLANYLPIKQLKPDLAFLINTDYTQRKGLDKRFKFLLDSQSIKAVNAPQLAPEDNFVQLLAFFTDLKEYIKSQSWTDITLNITGGTKLMSIAAYQVLSDSCHQIIYLNTAKDQIQLFKRDEFIQLDNKLIGVDEYLYVQRVHASKADVVTDDWLSLANSRRLLTEKILNFSNDPDNSWFVGTLNFQASNAIKRNRLKDGTFETVFEPKRRFNKSIGYAASRLLEACEESGLLSYDGQRAIEIASIEAAQYLSGMWLEEYCYFVARELGVHEIRCGQPIVWETDSKHDDEIDNEIDVLIVHNNRMLIIECKTGNLDSNVPTSNEIIYKLDSIASDFRGLYGDIWLLSAREIKDKRILNRAKSQNVRIIHGAGLAYLKKEIQQWARLN